MAITREGWSGGYCYEIRRAYRHQVLAKFRTQDRFRVFVP